MASAKRLGRAVRIGAAIVLALVVVVGIAWWFRRPAGAPVPRFGLSIADVRAPAGVRIRVQVLNATASRGLARRAMHHLRDRGFDVVDVGTAPAAERRDTTLVLDRSGHPEWARLVAGALGAARVEARRDSSRYLDATVLLGTTYRSPAEAFHP